VQLVFKIINLCGRDPPTLQTVGRSAYNRNTALCTRASRGKIACGLSISVIFNDNELTKCIIYDEN